MAVAGLAWAGLQARSKGSSARGNVLRLGTLGGATVLATTSSWLMCALKRQVLLQAKAAVASAPNLIFRLCMLLLRTALRLDVYMRISKHNTDVRRFILFTKFPGDACTWCLTSALLSLSILVTATRGFSGRSASLNASTCLLSGTRPRTERLNTTLLAFVNLPGILLSSMYWNCMVLHSCEAARVADELSSGRCGLFACHC